MVPMMDIIYSALELLSVMGSTCLAHAKKLKNKTSSHSRKTERESVGGQLQYHTVDPQVII